MSSALGVLAARRHRLHAQGQIHPVALQKSDAVDVSCGSTSDLTFGGSMSASASCGHAVARA
jgi:hypothetical protein